MTTSCPQITQVYVRPSNGHLSPTKHRGVRQDLAMTTFPIDWITYATCKDPSPLSLLLNHTCYVPRHNAVCWWMCQNTMATSHSIAEWRWNSFTETWYDDDDFLFVELPREAMLITHTEAVSLPKNNYAHTHTHTSRRSWRQRWWRRLTTRTNKQKWHWQCHPLSIYRHKLQWHISQLHPKIQSHTKCMCSAKLTDWSLIFTTITFLSNGTFKVYITFFLFFKKIIRHLLEHVNVLCSEWVVNHDYPWSDVKLTWCGCV